MKRFLALLCVTTLLLCTGCGLFDARTADPKTFSADGLTITMTKLFTQTLYENYTVCFEGPDSAVFALKEEFSLSETLADMTLERYAELVRKNNLAHSPGAVQSTEGLTVIEYNAYLSEQSLTYSYFTTLYKSDDAFWIIQFCCEKSLYEGYRPYFITWAKSVSFD